MIEIYEGRLGGGKTYSAVVRILDHLRKGCVVVTNVKLKWEACAALVADRFGVHLEADQLIALNNSQIAQFHEHIPHGSMRGAGGTRVLVVLDEIHLWFNSRDWATASKKVLSFLTQSDKVSVDLILIAQSMFNIDKQFVRLVQFIWRFRDMAKWTIPGLGVRWPMDQILACQFDLDGKTLLNRWFRKKDKRIFGCYETAAMFEEFPALDGVQTKRELKKVERKTPKMVKIMILVGIIAGVVAMFGMKERFFSKGAAAGPVGLHEAAGAASLAKSPLERSEAVGKAAYDIYSERFVSYWGKEHSLQTEGGWYVPGEMSAKGYVLATSDRRAKIAEPDGRVGWVVAEDVADATGGSVNSDFLMGSEKAVVTGTGGHGSSSGLVRPVLPRLSGSGAMPSSRQQTHLLPVPVGATPKTGAR